MLTALVLAALALPIEVSTPTKIAMPPATIRVRVRIEPHEGNRRAAVGLQCGEFTVSGSEWTIGEREPISKWVEFKDIREECEYLIVGLLERSTGEVFRAETRVIVGRPPTGESEY